MYIVRAYYQATGYDKTASVLTLLEGVVFFVSALYMLSRISFTALWMSLAVCVVVFLMRYRAKMKVRKISLCLAAKWMLKL